jgi:hypothetical protein
MPISQRNHSERKNPQSTQPFNYFLKEKYFLVSEDNIEQLEDYSNNTSKFDISLFLLSISISLVITLLTSDINKYLVYLMITLSSITGVAGVIIYVWFYKKKKQISKLIKKIKRNKVNINFQVPSLPRD